MPGFEQMRDTLVQLRKDEEFKKLQEARALKEENRKRKQAIAADDLEKEGEIYNPHTGRNENIWDLLNNAIDKALNSEDMMSYQDFRSAIISLMHLYGLLGKALQHDGAKVVQAFMDKLENEGLFPAINWLEDQVRQEQEIDLPVLTHSVAFSDSDELQIDPLIRSDHGEATALDSVFEIGINLWLKENGYVPDAANPKKYVHELDGSPLDKATFDMLKLDDDRGLDTFLRDNTDVPFNPSPRP